MKIRVLFFFIIMSFFYMSEGRALDVGCYALNSFNQKTLEGILNNVPPNETQPQQTYACNVTFPPQCQGSCIPFALQMGKAKLLKNVPHKSYIRLKK